jgi:hypothetical protein
MKIPHQTVVRTLGLAVAAFTLTSCQLINGVIGLAGSILQPVTGALRHNDERELPKSLNAPRASDDAQRLPEVPR